MLTQYRPHNLNDHIGISKPWDLTAAAAACASSSLLRRRGQTWYAGTADAIYQNLDFIKQNRR